jgi:hypothetical protein
MIHYYKKKLREIFGIKDYDLIYQRKCEEQQNIKKFMLQNMFV